MDGDENVPSDDIKKEKILNSAVKIVQKSYENCVLEFDSLGIIPTISDTLEPDGDSFVLYFGVNFAGQAKEYLEKCNLLDDVEDRLFGFIVIELVSIDEFVFSWVSGKRLYIDESYLPKNTFEKKMSVLDDETKTFLNLVGRGLAIGAALGAIDRFNDFVIEKVKEEP